MSDIWSSAFQTFGEEALQFMEEHRKDIEFMIKTRTPEFDECWSEILWRLPRIIELWDPARSTLKTYAYANIRWYIHKWVGQQTPAVECVEKSYVQHDDPLDGVSNFSKHLIKQVVLERHTLNDIAEVNGWTIAQCRRHIKNAFEEARWRLSGNRS